MSFFRRQLTQKTVASFLIVCVVGVASSLILLYPQKTSGIFDASPVVEDWTDPRTSAPPGLMFTTWGIAASTATLAVTKTAEYGEKLTLENVLSAFALFLAHTMAADLTNEIIEYIQTDGGSGFFSEGFGNFLLDGIDNAVGSWIDQYLGAGYLCEPFDLGIEFMLLQETTFITEATCSLSDILEAQGQTLENFWGDFTKGGFAAFIETTKPGGNFYSAAFLAQRNIDEVRSSAEDELKFDISSGRGYLSIKECIWYDRQTGARVAKKEVVGIPKDPAACASTVAGCERECVILTPGSTRAEMVDLATAQPYERLNQIIGNAMGKLTGWGMMGFEVYIYAIADTLINWLFEKGYGLLRAPAEEVPDQPEYNPGGTVANDCHPSVIGLPCPDYNGDGMPDDIPNGPGCDFCCNDEGTAKDHGCARLRTGGAGRDDPACRPDDNQNCNNGIPPERPDTPEIPPAEDLCPQEPDGSQTLQGTACISDDDCSSEHCDPCTEVASTYPNCQKCKGTYDDDCADTSLVNDCVHPLTWGSPGGLPGGAPCDPYHDCSYDRSCDQCYIWGEYIGDNNWIPDTGCMRCNASNSWGTPEPCIGPNGEGSLR